ncbi:MAG: InlB B-repeat-containing protein, partial [Prevotellaceae bacterium]|nr:InlB B-repeat-containing protein [Prevotellaceae bacterium]
TPSPTKSGFTFVGWYKESGCTNVWNFSVDVVNSNVTLFAKWSTIPPLPVFKGLPEECTVGSTIPLEVKGVGSENLTIFRVNGQESSSFNPATKGTYTIEATSADGKLKIRRIIEVK